MTAAQQQRLTENIKADGVLTSLPLVWLMQVEDGTPTATPPVYEIVSGNHRVISAKEAGLLEIDVIVIVNWISPARRVQIQLAHNAVGGQDDLSILEQLYEGLDLAGKQYSGLTDDAFASLRDISMSGFSVDGPEYQEVYLTFLPEDATQFENMVTRAAKASKAIHHAAHIETFASLFDSIVRVKESQNIQNNAVAISTLAELAMERLDQIEAEAARAVQDDASLIDAEDNLDDQPAAEVTTTKGRGKKKGGAAETPATIAREEMV